MNLYVNLVFLIFLFVVEEHPTVAPSDDEAKPTSSEIRKERMDKLWPKFYEASPNAYAEIAEKWNAPPNQHEGGTSGGHRHRPSRARHLSHTSVDINECSNCKPDAKCLEHTKSSSSIVVHTGNEVPPYKPMPSHVVEMNECVRVNKPIFFKQNRPKGRKNKHGGD